MKTARWFAVPHNKVIRKKIGVGRERGDGKEENSSDAAQSQKRERERMNQFLQQKEEGKLFTHFRSLEIEKDKKKTEKSHWKSSQATQQRLSILKKKLIQCQVDYLKPEVKVIQLDAGIL